MHLPLPPSRQPGGSAQRPPWITLRMFCTQEIIATLRLTGAKPPPVNTAVTITEPS